MQVKFSGSFRRYRARVLGKKLSLPQFREQVAAQFGKNRFGSIENLSAETKSVGWSALDGRSPADFDELELWLGSTLIVGVRIDEKRIPGGALKVRVAEAEFAERQSVESKILPARRREIREGIERELLARAIPSSQVHQLLWNVEGGQLLLSTTTEAANSSFRALFRETFDKAPVPLTPLQVPELLPLSAVQRKELDNLQPVVFAAGH